MTAREILNLDLSSRVIGELTIPHIRKYEVEKEKEYKELINLLDSLPKNKVIEILNGMKKEDINRTKLFRIDEVLKNINNINHYSRAFRYILHSSYTVNHIFL